MPWTTNPIMEWSDDGGTTWYQISDHGRDALSISVERLENKQRMANGTMRRYVVAKKYSFSMAYTNLPSVATSFLANGQPGQWMEDWHNEHDGAFLMRLRAGSDRDNDLQGLEGKVLTVMISDFSKEVVKRSPQFDIWNLDITLEEV